MRSSVLRVISVLPLSSFDPVASTHLGFDDAFAIVSGPSRAVSRYSSLARVGEYCGATVAAC